jgi:hypothetical protein
MTTRRPNLSGTYCLYNGKAFVVKLIEQMAANQYMAAGQFFQNGKPIECLIDDPDFNCSDYNVGYVNYFHSGAWFYRLPMKQYSQGLRSNQCGLRASNPNFSDVSLGFNKPVGKMLENDYPKYAEAADLLKTEQAKIVAFHKDFAMTYDEMHKDFILEYKGNRIGYTHDLAEVKFMTEFEYLNEALKEAVA